MIPLYEQLSEAATDTHLRKLVAQPFRLAPDEREAIKRLMQLGKEAAIKLENLQSYTSKLRKQGIHSEELTKMSLDKPRISREERNAIIEIQSLCVALLVALER